MSTFICQGCFKFLVLHPSFEKINLEECRKNGTFSLFTNALFILLDPDIHEALKYSEITKNNQNQEDGSVVDGLISEFYDVGELSNESEDLRMLN
jgi:hypothetical protein